LALSEIASPNHDPRVAESQISLRRIIYKSSTLFSIRQMLRWKTYSKSNKQPITMSRTQWAFDGRRIYYLKWWNS